jgi:hypothetical protein
MRRVLVVEKVNGEAESLAEQLGCPEIACNVPRFEGYIDSLPSVVIESATNPGVILGVFNASMISKEDLDSLQDLPETPAPVIRDPIAEIDILREEFEAERERTRAELLNSLERKARSNYGAR